MDSEAEMEPVSIKLRRYAKKRCIGRLKQVDGTVIYVPGQDEEAKRHKELKNEIVRIEKMFGTGKRASLLSRVSN